MALIGLCALTQPDRHPQLTAPSRTSAKGFARPLFEGHFKFCPLLEKMEEGTVSKKEASSSHTSNTKLKEFDMTRRRTFEILTFEAAAVSITCQETQNRTASPFDEDASRTNEIPRKFKALSHFSASRTTTNVLQCSLQLRTNVVRGH